MKEARCQPSSGGVVKAGSYIAGRTFGDFARASHDILIKSYGATATVQTDTRSHSHATAHVADKRHHPHHDDRRFLMLIDHSGKEQFKACSPTCVDVNWSDVPVRKRIPGFGRKSKEQNTMPQDFIPEGLTTNKWLSEGSNDQLARSSKAAVTFPNATSPHIPFKKDDVSYRAVMNTPFDVDFEKCVSHLEQKGPGWTEEERCHRIDWDEIPVGDFIAGFGRKGGHHTKDLLAGETPLTKREDLDDEAQIASIVYGDLLDSGATSYMATRNKWGKHVNMWECGAMIKSVDQAKLEPGCTPLKDKFTFGSALGGTLAIFPGGSSLQAGATAVLFLMTCPLGLFFLFLGQLLLLSVPVGLWVGFVALRKAHTRWFSNEDVEDDTS